MSASYRTVVVTTGTDATAEGALTGISDGDIMVAFLSHSSSSATMSTPAAGWDLVEADPNPADFSLLCYKRVKQSGDSAPTWTWSVAGSWTVDIIAYSGQDTSTPLDDTSGTQGAAINTITTASVTPAVTDCVLIWYACTDATGTARTWTQSGSPTERLDQMDNQLHRCIAEEVISTSGSGITRDATVSGTAQDIGAFAVLVRPASGISINKSESVGNSETVTVSLPNALTADKNETVGNTEAITMQMVSIVAVSEAIGTAESVGVSISFGINVNDAINTAESHTEIVSSSQIDKSETIGTSESHAEIIGTSQINVSEVLGAITESVNLSVSTVIAVSEVIGTAENHVEEIVTSIVVSDVTGITDTPALSVLEVGTLSANVQEAVTTSEAIQAVTDAPLVNVSDAINTAENTAIIVESDLPTLGIAITPDSVFAVGVRIYPQ